MVHRLVLSHGLKRTAFRSALWRWPRRCLDERLSKQYDTKVAEYIYHDATRVDTNNTLHSLQPLSFSHTLLRSVARLLSPDWGSGTRLPRQSRCSITFIIPSSLVSVVDRCGQACNHMATYHCNKLREMCHTIQRHLGSWKFRAPLAPFLIYQLPHTPHTANRKVEEPVS